MTSTDFSIPPESPFGRLLFPLLGTSLGVLFFVTRHASAPALATALAGILCLGYLPGLAFSLWGERRFGLWSSWILPLLISPVLVTAAALGMAWFGVSLDGSASWIVLASLLAVVAAPQPGREIEDWAVSLEMPSLIRRRSDRQQVVFLASAVLILIAWPLLQHEWLRFVQPAGEHTAVVRELNRILPPWDPFLAGYAYAGPWAFHVYVAVLEEATRMGADTLFIGGTLIAAFVIVFSCYRAATLLGVTHSQALWGTLLVFFSLGSMEWIRFGAAGLLEGEQPVLPLLAHGAGSKAGFFLDHFIGMFPLVWSLAYFLLFLIAAAATIGDPRSRWNILLFLAASGMFLFQPDLGAVSTIVLVLAIPVTWLLSKLNPFRGDGLQLGMTLIPIAIALVVALPYLREITQASGARPQTLIEMSWGKSARLLLVVAPQLLIAIPVWGGFLISSEIRRHIWVVYSVFLLVVALALDLSEPGHFSKLVVFCHIPLALAAGTAIPSAWERAGRWMRVAVGLVVMALVVPGLIAHVAWYSQSREASRFDETAQTTEAVRWIVEHTPMHAVVVDRDDGLALRANRALLVETDRLTARSNRASPTAARTEAFARLMIGNEVDGFAFQDLTRLHAPIYVVWRLPDEEDRMPSPQTREVFRNSGFIIQVWEPSETDGP